MLKKLILLLLLLPKPSVQAAELELPPLPDSEKIAIVVMKEPQTEASIRRLLNPYPELRLRHVFKEAMWGFSVEGKLSELKKIEKLRDVQAVSPVKSYTADAEPGITIIGGDNVRRFFDEHNRRITGKGVKVGVIDTGIDYNHPDLRRNYGGGHDLVDNDSDPMETQSIAGDATSHGTHVAGIIAANGKIKGVAPEATIIAYRALGPGGSGTTEQVISAIEQAIKDRVDIVNLSLGNSVNGPDLPISTALNKVVDKGIVAVTSSGNSGPDNWTVGSPGTASKAISVGASTPPMRISYLTIEETRQRIRLEQMSGADDWRFDRTMDLAHGGIGEKSDLKDVRNKVVLIERGRVTFSEKVKNAQNAGAKGVVIYNNTKGRFHGSIEEPVSIPAASVTKEEGEALLKSMKRGNSMVSFSSIEESDRLADFSSRGPVTVTWEIKPDVLAPGVAIKSTVPGGYLPLQGTSMAAPHVAGACALIKQAHPDWTPQQIKAAIMNTARPLVKSGNSLYRTFEQGAGRLQIEEAIQSKSFVMPSSLQFGKFQLANKRGQHTAFVTVENKSDRTIGYSFQIPPAIKGLNWHMPMSFRLRPSEKKEVAIELEVKPGEFKGKLHDGYLTMLADGRPIHLPYLYVFEEPNYPRVMGFVASEGDEPGSLRFEVYLPGGAEEFGIALFQQDDFRFEGYLDIEKDVKKGLLKKQIPATNLPKPGNYAAKIFARKAGREDTVETIITIPKVKGSP